MFLIPRNYSDNGRIMGLFEGRLLLPAAAVFIPISAVIIWLPLLPLMVKGIIWGLLAFLPALIILSGLADCIIHRWHFKRDAGVYYLD